MPDSGSADSGSADSGSADSGIDAAVEVLRGGGLVAFPTETVYGLGADASNPEAIARCFAAKGRPSDHPVIVHLGDPSALEDWSSEVPSSARRLVDACWPGPLTVIVPRAAHVLDAVTGGQDTVGLRMPDHPIALGLLRAFDGGLVAPSANRFGSVSPTTADAVIEEFGDPLEDGVNLVLDGGPCAVGVESTIVDCTADPPRVLRPGAVSASRVAEVVGTTETAGTARTGDTAQPSVSDESTGPRVPGTLATHYAPSARVIVVDETREAVREVTAALASGCSVGVLAAPSDMPSTEDVVELAVPADAAGYARELYERLRDADRRRLDVVVAVPPARDGIGAAVADRLARAAGSGP